VQESSVSQSINGCAHIECVCPWLKGTAIPAIGCGGLDSCEMSRIPHFLDNQLTDGGEVIFVRFEVSEVLTMKNAVFWYVMPCGCYKNRCFREM
jgi:hypothetical protein